MTSPASPQSNDAQWHADIDAANRLYEPWSKHRPNTPSDHPDEQEAYVSGYLEACAALRAELEQAKRDLDEARGYVKFWIDTSEASDKRVAELTAQLTDLTKQRDALKVDYDSLYARAANVCRERDAAQAQAEALRKERDEARAGWKEHKRILTEVAAVRDRITTERDALRQRVAELEAALHRIVAYPPRNGRGELVIRAEVASIANAALAATPQRAEPGHAQAT